MIPLPRVFSWSVPAFLALALAGKSEGQGFYYKLETVAASGQAADSGDVIASFRSVSINESGTVAMAAVVNASPARQGIFVSGLGAVPKLVGNTSDITTTTSASIAGDGKVAAHEQSPTLPTQPSAIRVWDPAVAAVPPPLMTSQGAGVQILTPVSRANDGKVLFVGVTPRRLYLNSTGATNQKTDLGVVAPNAQAWVASGGSYVLREGTGSAGSLSVDPPSGARRAIATAGASGSWSEIGNLPGISDSGKVVAFAGEPSGEDPGIFLWFDEPGDPELAAPVRILGFRDARDGLGYDDDNSPVFFDLFDTVQRVGVQHREAGPAGLEGDEIILCFIAKPVADSFTNPHTGFPMLHTDQPGLWVVHLTPSRDLRGQGPLRMDVKTSPMPVIQVGGFVDNEAVTSILLNDPLAFAEKTPQGFGRVTIGPADHYVGFEVVTASGTRRVLRASQFDSDFDGLFDHWEEIGGGLDVNRDGTVDLVLSDFGADPYRKDAFFEIDWSAPWSPEPGTLAVLEPPAAALQHLVDRFAAAPVPNPVGPPGITAHIDAGLTRSINMPAGTNRDGGDEMVDPQGGGVVDIIYSNDTDYQKLPPEERGNMIERSAKVMRDRYFGRLESNARELVFRHIMIAPLIGADYSGDLVGLGEGSPFAQRPKDAAEPFTDVDGDGAWFEGDVSRDPNGNGVHDPGEPFYDLREPLGQYDPPEPFTDTNGNGYRDEERPESSRAMPGNSILIGLQGRYDSPSGTAPVYFPMPGVPDRVPAPTAILLVNTLYHEVGHVMGLLHGGSDDWTGNALPTPKPGYLSVMNYRYGAYPDRSGNFHLDFSSGGGGGDDFNDWSIFRMDFARYFDCLGDQRLGSRLTLLNDPPHRHGVTVKEIEAVFGEAAAPLPPRIDPYLPDAGLSDADGDGLVRLLEEALGLNPAVADAAGAVTMALDRTVQPPLLTLTFPKDTSRTDLELSVQFSTDLVNWSGEGITETEISTTGNIRRLRASKAMATPLDTGFYRLKVTRR